MSVVDGDFDALKRYNLNELYVSAIQAKDKEEESTKEQVSVGTANQGELKESAQ